MTTMYPRLTYRMSYDPEIEEGDLLGLDEVGRPYEVIDWERVDADTVVVHLQYGTKPSIDRQLSKLYAMVQGMTAASEVQR